MLGQRASKELGNHVVQRYFMENKVRPSEAKAAKLPSDRVRT